MQPILFRAPRVIDPASGFDATADVLVADGRIAAIAPDGRVDSVPEGTRTVEGAGLCLAPGLVDMRVATGEPGAEQRETLATASRAAVAGGVTSFALLPPEDAPVDDAAALEFVARRAREAKLAKVYAYAAITRGFDGQSLAEIGLLAEAGAVGFTDGRRAIASAAVMARALSYTKPYGALVLQHPQEPSMAKGAAMTAGLKATQLGLAGLNPMAELILLERDLRLAEMTGGRYHAALLSTEAAVEAIRTARRRGLAVTCDTAPPYFALTEQDVGDYRTFAKLMPPLRTEMDRRAIADAVADGTIDIICSDHDPQDVDAKRVPFAQAAFGAVGLETLLPLSLELVHKGGMSLPALLHRLTVAPAQALGLQAGRLQQGAAADLVLFDAEVPWRIDADRLTSKSRNTPFDRRPVQGRVEMTLVDGRAVYERADAA